MKSKYEIKKKLEDAEGYLAVNGDLKGIISEIALLKWVLDEIVRCDLCGYGYSVENTYSVAAGYRPYKNSPAHNTINKRVCLSCAQAIKESVFEE